MSSGTQTVTHTTTHARHIAAKVAADLKRVQRIYGQGQPTDKEIDEYQQELIKLLDKGYLSEVTYGFQKNGKWRVALKYLSTGQGNISTNNDPGGIKYQGEVDDTYFASFLSYSQPWYELSTEDRERFKETLPFKRTGAPEPGVESGSWAGSRFYTSGSMGVNRTMLER